MSRSTFTSERRLLMGVLLAFIGVGIFAAVDIVADLHEGAASGHVVTEAGILLVAMLGSIFMVYRLVLTLRRARAVQEEAIALAAQLEATRAEASRWRSEVRDLMKGLRRTPRLLPHVSRCGSPRTCSRAIVRM